MANTPVYGWPYQTLADTPDGPNLGEDLALAVEATLVTVEADISAILATLAAAMDQALVATSQATSSTSFTDLATVGPAVTKTIGASGKALVVVTAFVFNGTAGAVNYMGFAVSGATTVAASDDRALILHSETVNGQNRASAVHLQTGLNAGSNTFTAKYRVNSGSGTYSNRGLIVVAF